MRGMLDGVRVIDFTANVSGPATTTFLAETYSLQPPLDKHKNAPRQEGVYGKLDPNCPSGKSGQPSLSSCDRTATRHSKLLTTLSPLKRLDKRCLSAIS